MLVVGSYIIIFGDTFEMFTLWLIASIFLFITAYLTQSSFLTWLSVFALANVVGATTGYGSASYFF